MAKADDVKQFNATLKNPEYHEMIEIDVFQVDSNGQYRREWKEYYGWYLLPGNTVTLPMYVDYASDRFIRIEVHGHTSPLAARLTLDCRSKKGNAGSVTLKADGDGGWHLVDDDSHNK